ncbi:MAG TPA: peptide ABC transporter substrate-binding protein [Ktedonosporobacter sp.]|nr:peptide ABC transporter substrate-binding protein [Ktedonosporobacter sp.]
MQFKRRQRSFIFSICLILLGLLLAACGGSTAQQSSNNGKAPDNQQVLVIPISGVNDLQSFDPALVTEPNSINAVNMVFTGLVQLDDHLQVQDQLAASHSVSSDGLTWTFKLKPGLKFSDGAALTSDDVAYSLDRALDPNLKSAVSTVYLGLLKDAQKRAAGQVTTLIGDSILTPDKQTIVLKTSANAAYFLQTLTYQTSYVVEKSMIDKYGNSFASHLSEGIGGDGPFKVTSYTPGQSIVFVPNDNYYGPHAQLKKVVMAFYKQSDSVFRAYQNGQIDWANVPSSELETVKGQAEFHRVPQLKTDFYTMNYLAPPFNNVKIRQAFDLALNKDVIAHSIYKDKVIPSNHILPSGMVGYNPNLTGPQAVTSTQGNATLAKQLLADGMKEEGYTAATFPSVTLSFSTMGFADTENEVSATQQMWKQVLGINVQLREIDFNTLLVERTKTANNPHGMQMWRLYWSADYPDPQNWLTLIFDKGSPKNAFNYGQNNTPEAKAQQANQLLMEQADSNQNATERISQYNQAEQALVNDVAWIPIFQDAQTLMRKSCVVGVVDNAQNFIPANDWGNIYISSATPCVDTSMYH